MNSKTNPAKTFEVKTSSSHTMFLPAFIDDYGLTPEEFRVFSRIMRRSLGGRDCYESIPSLARTLLISERLVRRALKVLEECGAIVRITRSGKSDLYDFSPTQKWKPQSSLATIRRKISAEIADKDRARKAAEKGQPLAFPQGVTPCGNATTPLAIPQPVPLAETPGEGTPLKVYSIKEKKQNINQNFEKTSSDVPKASAATFPKSVSQTPVAKQSAEPDADYLARKQSEFPEHNISQLFERFCEHRLKNNLPIVRKVFDVWCEKEEKPMAIPAKIQNKNLTPAQVRAEAEKLIAKKYGGAKNA